MPQRDGDLFELVESSFESRILFKGCIDSRETDSTIELLARDKWHIHGESKYREIGIQRHLELR
ncbi:hypothetical protein M7I_3837 [Glarea lozoyensis 74030]|uniref:Uncharacterized protein n=1 Tax=Glarea lozoyensis (strain ATCC 74030 / MF5533) TaxID=1104152 RepID=H0EMJ9_GLAL7|nr:hypothetical protein M7I_3837 [Glarea lozoyensis 74030]